MDNKTKVPSKQWSCSELTDGNRKLMAVKSETAGLDNLAVEIEESFRILPSNFVRITLPFDDLRSFHICMLKTIFTNTGITMVSRTNFTHMFVDMFGGMFGYPIQKSIPFPGVRKKDSRIEKAKAGLEVSEPCPLKAIYGFIGFPLLVKTSI